MAGGERRSVLQLAAQLYPAQKLTAADANTIQCQVVSPVTYIPIPAGAGGSFAGLLTVELPPSVRYGNEFDIVVRRITTKQVFIPAPPKTPPPPSRSHAPSHRRARSCLWRYVTGSFLVKIPVKKESTILPGDENLLAILKWRLGLIDPRQPLVSGVAALDRISLRPNQRHGRQRFQIPPSPTGYQPPSTGPVKRDREHCYTGKVIGIHYNRFGDFEGFTILSEKGHEHWFRGREHEDGRTRTAGLD